MRTSFQTRCPPLILSLLSVAAVTLLAGSAQAQQPNIVLIMADDMGWGDPSYNSTNITFVDGSPHPDQGWIQTPTLDAMAANGIRFDRFYSASAVCSPTRASCLTGRNPFRVGVPTANAGRLGFDETPLSTLLAAQGYTCGHFGKWHLGTMTTLRTDLNRGREGNTADYSAPWHHDYDSCFATESKVPTYHPYRKASNGTALPTSFSDSNFFGTRYWRMPATWSEASGEGDAVPVGEVNNAVDGDDSRLLAGHTIDFIRTAVSNSEPFFVALWLHTPHQPLVDPEGVSGVDSSDACKDGIEDMDEAIGMVRDELTTLGVHDNTMMWLTSDNGPEDGVNSPNESNTVRSIRSGRLKERKRSLYEGGVRVPGILEWPNVVTNGFATDFPAFTSDYYPTILDYLSLSVANQKPLDGISLRPLIEGIVTERAKPMGFLFSGKQSWVADRYKLIKPTGTGDWELYDLDNVAAGEELEQTALATASNVGSQSQDVQDIYNTMLAEFNAWNATVSSDTPYVHSSQPAVALSSTNDTSPFTVDVRFSETVTGLVLADFSVSNGSASNLVGAGTNWTVTVTVSNSNPATVSLPDGAVFDLDGNPNGVSTLVLQELQEQPGAAGPIISNGDLEISVAEAGASNGNTPYYLDATNNVLRDAGVDTGVNTNEWLWAPLSRGFQYSATGGRGGSGGFTQSGIENGNARAVLQFARNNRTTVGDVDISMDVSFQDDGGGGDLRFYVELFAWPQGVRVPSLTVGGPTADVATYNTWEMNGAVRVLETTVYASNVAASTWASVELGTVDLGIGYDYYAWRIGVVGANDGDLYAFDNVTVSAVTGHRFLDVANHSFTNAANFDFRNNANNLGLSAADIGDWVCRELNGDSGMDIGDITSAGFASTNNYSQDGATSMCFQKPNKRGLVQIIDVTGYVMADMKVTLGAIFSSRSPDHSAVLKMVGFNAFDGLIVDLGGDWSFTGGDFVHDYGTNSIPNADIQATSCIKSLSGTAPADFDYLAILVGGYATDSDQNSDWVAVDDVTLFLPPPPGTIVIVK